MLYRADTVLPVVAEPIARGAVRVEKDCIVEVGRAEDLTARPGEKVVDLGACTLLPGLINGHCHLDYTHFRGAISPGHSFTEWIKTINALRRSFGPSEFIESIAEGFQLLEASGTTTVANIESLPELLPLLPVPPLRTWWFMELIDVRKPDERRGDALRRPAFFRGAPGMAGRFRAFAACALHGVGRPLPAGPRVRRHARDAGDDAHRRVGGGARDVHQRARGALRLPRRDGARQLGLRAGLGSFAPRRARRDRPELDHRAPELPAGLRLRARLAVGRVGGALPRSATPTSATRSFRCANCASAA